MRYLVILFSSIFLLMSSTISGQKKIFIPGQSKEFSLYTNIDTAILKKYKKALSFANFEMSKLLEYRDFARPYAYANDPLGEFLYAKTFDLYPFGMGDPISGDTALFYYKRAADKNFAAAEAFLFKTYKYGFMGVKEDSEEALKYLRRYLLHGDSLLKAEAHRQMALLYYHGDFEEIKIDTAKTMEHLKLSLENDPSDSWTIDFLGGLYQDKGYYHKAMELLLKSDNNQSLLKVAKWMIEGEKVEKNFEKGLAIILNEAEKLMQSEDNVYQFMGSRNPVFMLNDLYQSKLITRDQLGKFYLENYFGDN